MEGVELKGSNNKQISAASENMELKICVGIE